MSIITRENPFILKTIEADKENLQRYVTLCDEWIEVAAAKIVAANKKSVCCSGF